MTRLYKLNTGKVLHRDPAISILIEDVNGVPYLATVPFIATTPTIINQAITNDNWIQIGSTLSGVLSWRLSEQSGEDFRYAFVSSPPAFITAFGWVSEMTAITQIFAKRVRTKTYNMELITWGV